MFAICNLEVTFSEASNRFPTKTHHHLWPIGSPTLQLNGLTAYPSGPLRAARNSGVEPSTMACSLSAPASRSTWQTSTWPFWLAICKAVVLVKNQIVMTIYKNDHLKTATGLFFFFCFMTCFFYLAGQKVCGAAAKSLDVLRANDCLTTCWKPQLDVHSFPTFAWNIMEHVDKYETTIFNWWQFMLASDSSSLFVKWLLAWNGKSTTDDNVVLNQIQKKSNITYSIVTCH